MYKIERIEAPPDEEKPLPDPNPFHTFLAYPNIHLKWSDEGGLEVDPSGSQDDTVNAVAQALFSKSSYDVEDISEDLLERIQNRRRLENQETADKISSHFIQQWLADYLSHHPEDEEASKAFVNAVFKHIKYYNCQKFLNALEAYLKVYRTADESFRPTLLKLCQRHPKLFADPSEGRDLFSVLEQQNPVLNSCLKVIAGNKDRDVLENWLWSVSLSR